LEGYFVRTLGMHRVYNSAFMNMLRDEDNAKYRSVIKNTLEFDPEILKRFVSFMNNPDEETTVAQFGKGDKYFGICVLLSTLPGLPMFGHGQIEGLAEKYGMEYRRAYWDEQPDGYLIERHEREIFPLLHRRHLFAGVEDFLLYDFFTPEGSVNEDVFAYSNRSGDERALVIYHNRFSTARGWIKTSVAYSTRAGGDGSGSAGSSTERVLVQKSLGEGLGLSDRDDHFYIFRDHLTGQEYLRSGRELCRNGLYVELEAYKCHVFVDWREMQDNEWHQYAHLANYLGGRGVPSIEEALREVFLQPIPYPFKEMVNADTFRRLMDGRVTEPDGELDADLVAEVQDKTQHLLREMKRFLEGDGDDEATLESQTDAIATEVRLKLEASLQLPILGDRFPLPRSRKYKAAGDLLREQLGDDPAAWGTLFGWLFTHALGKVAAGAGPERDTIDYAAQSRSWIDEWLLGKIMAGTLQDLGLDEAAAWWAVGTVKILINHQGWCDPDGGAKPSAHQILTSWLRDSEIQQFLRVNRYGGLLWFNHEAFEQLLRWMLVVAVVDISADPERSPKEVAQEIVACYDVIKSLVQAEEASEYQVVKLMEAAQG
jgi:hypothetical protein